MINILKFIFVMSFFLNSTIILASKNNSNRNFSKMSCYELMLGFMRESALNDKFQDKKLELELFFERDSDRYLGLTLFQNGGGYNGVYGNYELDLQLSSLYYIDPSPSKLIRINKEYVPYIAKQCTSDKNLPLRIRHLPEPESE